MSALDKFFDSFVPTKAALADWKTPADTLIKFVVEKSGTYTFNASSTATADGEDVIAPTDNTPGRWIFNSNPLLLRYGNVLATIRGYDMP